MKLWILKAKKDLPKNDNPWCKWYDKFFGHIVRAETEEQARILAQQYSEQNKGDENRTVQAWVNPKYSSCVELLPYGESEVILSDYRMS